MKNQNEKLVKRAKEVIKSLELHSFDNGCKMFRNRSNEKISENLIKKETLSYSIEEGEQCYLFVNKVVKQIRLMILR